MALVEPNVERIAPRGTEPSDDRAPDWVAEGTPEPLRADLAGILGEDRVLGRASDLVRYASDASPYRIIPSAVVMSHDAGDISKLLGYGRRTGTPITFRAGGTSLNGQGQSGGVLVDVRKHWRGVSVEDDGARVRVKPGTVLGHVNRVLAPLGRALGPDPASTDIACVGGVIANNSGGMRCGIVRDSYQTVRGLTFVLPSGTVIDSDDPDAELRFAEAEPELTEGLIEIRDEIRADTKLAERIRKKFEIKNTTGYRLCAFLDADTPVEIFRRLLVGSEGTLGFVAEAVFETVPVPARTTVSWLHFPDIASATELVPALVAAGARAVELMVAPALIVASHNIRGTPQSWRELPPESAALLLEFGGADEAELDAAEAKAAEILEGRQLIREPDFHRDPETIEMYWTVREGLHGLIGKMKPPGTALIVEDVCVPPQRIAESAEDIRALLTEHGFLPGVAGHASAGNLHFMLTPDFSKPEDLERYEEFMGRLVDLVLDKYDGSLKAEHGTGINMAPYVEREWGERATEWMWRIKRLADPDGVLSPGVVLNRDPGVHLQNLKTTPPIEELATSCVECGFCEPVCPSRWVTTTPRQRIALRREMARQPAGSPVLRKLLVEYEYDGIETCAADGTCMLSCPVGIDTGKLIKSFREREHSARDESVALSAAKRWRTIESRARTGLRIGEAISGAVGEGPLRELTRAARGAFGSELVPEWDAGLPPAAPSELPATKREGAAAVYFPACINRIFGPWGNGGAQRSLPEVVVEVSERAGMPVWIPDDVAGRCCATPWSSKGYRRGRELMANEVVASMWRWSDGAALPVMIDATSCTEGVVADAPDALSEENRERHAQLEILDSIAWSERLLDRLEVPRPAGAVAVHPTCSARQLALDRRLSALAGKLADDVFVPPSAHCCGFAGDRGLLHPELTEAATRDEAEELSGREFDAYVSSNRTCEAGMKRATGRPYESIMYLLEAATTARSS